MVDLLEPTGPWRSRDALFGAVALGGGFEEIDQLHQRPLQAVDRVGAVVDGVGEELVTDLFLLELRVGFAAVGLRIMS